MTRCRPGKGGLCGVSKKEGRVEANAEYGADMRNLLEHANQDPGKAVSVRDDGGGDRAWRWAMANSWPGRAFPFESPCPSLVPVQEAAAGIFQTFFRQPLASPVSSPCSEGHMAGRAVFNLFLKCNRLLAGRGPQLNLKVPVPKVPIHSIVVSFHCPESLQR